MDDYIQKVKRYIASAIEEKNLNFLGTLLYQLTHYAIITNQENLIYLSSIMKDVVMGYDIAINEFELPENTENQLIDTFRRIINKAIDFLDKQELTQKDKIEIYDWNKDAKIHLEKDLFEVRYVKNYQSKSVEELI